MKTSWVVAFNRSRDFYQVPLALQERNRLAGLVSDFYAPPLGFLSRLKPFQRISRRRDDRIPFNKVQWNANALRLQLFHLPRARTGSERVEIFKRLDKNLSRAALRLALRKNADLLLYSGYAREAFESAESNSMTKGLFVFHPHGGPSLEILAADLEAHPEAAESHRWHRTEIELSDGERLDAETQKADFLICASSFTARTLGYDSFSKKPLTIAPYGCFLQKQSPALTSVKNRKVSFLFVGQGVQRKGLHHLLKVWKKLNPVSATLTIVASSFDPGFQKLSDQPSVTVLGSQSAANLQRLYEASDVFVMPSLIEGFGLVYLEALSAGCFVIGTENSGLPDLNLPDFCGRILQPGNLQMLREALEETIDRAQQLERDSIKNFAATCSWSAFRTAVADACQSAHAPVAP